MKLFNSPQNRLTLEELEHRRAHRSKGIQGILFVYGLVLLFFIAFLGFTLVLLPGISLRESITRKQQATELNNQKEQEKQRLAATLKAAQNNTEFNRTLAYDRGLARPDETIIRMQPEDKDTPPHPKEPALSPAEAP